MYKLIQISDKTYYISSMTNVGLYKTDGNKVILIDSGNSPSAGLRIYNILNSNGFDPDYILNTHSHADHIGANRFFRDNCKINAYVGKKELLFAREPIANTAVMYGGNPPKRYLNYLLCAEKSTAEPMEKAPIPPDFWIIPLKGHSTDMNGFKTPDGTVFLGDSVVGKKIIDANKIIYNYDIGMFLKTLETIKNIKGNLFIPSHGKPTEDIFSLAEYNKRNAYSTIELICELCADHITFENLLKKITDRYSIKLNYDKYVLITCSVRSYISYMLDENILYFDINDNEMLYKKK